MRTWGGAGRHAEARLFIPHEDVVALRRFLTLIACGMFGVGVILVLVLERMVP